MDLITYVEDLATMQTEGAAITETSGELSELFSVDSDGQLTFNVTKIPVTYTSNGKSLCLCRGVSRELIAQCYSIQVLGECINDEYIFDSNEARDIYEANYDTSTRYVDDGEGGTIEYTPPYMMGVFA